MLALNEIGAMVLKAARGAGIPLGQAEDLARVAIYLAGTHSKVGAITQALQETQTQARVDWDHDRLVVHAGPAALIAPIVRDAFAMGYDTAQIADLSHAGLVGAFLAENGVSLRWDGAVLRRSDTTVMPATCAPVTIPQEDWTIWGDLAARTYVPETEASRLAGAGAGLTDND